MKPETVLLEAAELGDLKAVKRHFEQGDIEDAVQKEIALIAADNDDLDLLRYVSNKNPSIVRKEGDPHYEVLRRAVARGALDVVKYLVEEHGADVLHKIPPYECAGDDSPLALLVALRKGHLDILKYFLEDRNIDIHTPIDEYDDSHHLTILFFALQYRVKDQILKYLVEERNASLTMENWRGEHVLYDATRENNLMFIKYALDERKAKIDINGRNKEGQTLVHFAVYGFSQYHFTDREPFHRLPLLEYLVNEKKADVNIADDEGNTPLYRAWSNETCSFLIEHGALVNLKNNRGDTPLQVAMYGGNQRNEVTFAWIKCLVERGADVNWNDVPTGETPLIAATKDVRAPDNENPAFSFRVCELLIRQGADINLADNFDNTPLRYTVMGLGADREGMFPERTLHLFRYYLELGADVNKCNKVGDCPLHWAARYSTRSVCQQLLDHGANIDQRNKKGETAVYCAVEHHRTDVLEYLVGEKHADLNIPTIENKTSPLHVAASMKDYHLCRYLVEHGAQTQVQDKDGRTPVQRASNKRVIDYLNKMAAKRDRRDVAFPQSRTLALPMIYELGVIPAKASLGSNHIMEVPSFTFASDSAQISNIHGLLALVNTLIFGPKTSSRSLHRKWGPEPFRMDDLDRRMESFFDQFINRLRNDNII